MENAMFVIIKPTLTVLNPNISITKLTLNDTETILTI